MTYDWNSASDAPVVPPGSPQVDDETLRDGAQSPSIRTPSTAEKIALLHKMVDLSIASVDIGLPAAGPRVREDVIALACEIAHHHLPIAPNCAARTIAGDIEPIVDASERAGIPIEASLFIGSSPVRQFVEGWSLDRMLRFTESAVTFARNHGLEVMFVTEDTTRARPDALQRLYATAIECGASRVCVTDTVGHATPHGSAAVVRFVRSIIEKSGCDVRIDWHGHCDRGLALANAIAAVEAGADRVHGTALGVGERCGNTPMEQILANFRLLGWIDSDLSSLPAYCDLAARAFEVSIPFNLPIVGSDAFCTSTGVHAAAVMKAEHKGDKRLADTVYSGVPAGWFGRRQRIEIGPMSGASNVEHWLDEHGVARTDELISAIVREAKKADRLLTEPDIRALIGLHSGTAHHG